MAKEKKEKKEKKVRVRLPSVRLRARGGGGRGRPGALGRPRLKGPRSRRGSQRLGLGRRAPPND